MGERGVPGVAPLSLEGGPGVCALGQRSGLAGGKWIISGAGWRWWGMRKGARSAEQAQLSAGKRPSNLTAFRRLTFRHPEGKSFLCPAPHHASAGSLRLPGRKGS